MSPDDIVDLFAHFGPVTVRRMFGGAGVYADGVMFALEADGLLYLKVDALTRADFVSEQCRPFTYTMRGSVKRMDSYWSLPERLYDGPEALADWARLAHAAAVRAASLKPKKKPAPKSRRAR